MALIIIVALFGFIALVAVVFALIAAYQAFQIPDPARKSSRTLEWEERNSADIADRNGHPVAAQIHRDNAESLRKEV